MHLWILGLAVVGLVLLVGAGFLPRLAFLMRPSALLLAVLALLLTILIIVGIPESEPVNTALKTSTFTLNVPSNAPSGTAGKFTWSFSDWLGFAVLIVIIAGLAKGVPPLKILDRLLREGRARQARSVPRRRDPKS
jgi:hypothetical protein